MKFDTASYDRKIYSQFGEDGITLELARRLDPPKRFVEIGAGNGLENCTRVLVDHGWIGEWFDPALKDENVPRGVEWWSLMVTAENIGRTKAEVDPRHVGVLSIDVDGNDYHLWRAYGPGPAIVIIEAQIQRPADVPWVMPYDPGYVWDHQSHDCGASLVSMVGLGYELGYTYLGRPANPHSPNMFFVRTDLVDRL